MTSHSPNETEGLPGKGLVKEMGGGKDRTKFLIYFFHKRVQKADTDSEMSFLACEDSETCIPVFLLQFHDPGVRVIQNRSNTSQQARRVSVMR